VRRGLVLLLCCGATPVLAQSPVWTALLQLEDGWASALVRRDSTYFRRTLATGFVYSEDAKSFTRAEVLNSLLDPADTVREAHNEAMTVHEFGGTAVVTGWLIVRGRNAGGPYDHRYRFTDTWMRQAGTWRIVAAHDYLMPQR
jgi:hypothetical protein